MVMEQVGEDAVVAAENARIRGKEGGRSPKTNNSSREGLFIPPERSPQVLLDDFVGNRCAVSEPPLVRMNSMNDGGDMVEELTLTPSNRSKIGREAMQIRKGQWQHLYQLGGGSGGVANGSSRLENGSKDKGPVMPFGAVDSINVSPSEMWIERHSPNKQLNRERAVFSRGNNDDNCGSPSGNRTKVISSSGFSQFFVKNSLKGKGTVHTYPERRDEVDVTSTRHDAENPVNVEMVVSDPLPILAIDTDCPSFSKWETLRSVQYGVSLREWLEPGRKVNKAENLHIFRQIVKLVDIAHSQQVALTETRPSSFRLLSSNQIKYVGSFGESPTLENKANRDVAYSTHHSTRKRLLEEDVHPYSLGSKQQKLNHDMNFARQDSNSANVSGDRCGTSVDMGKPNTGSDSGFDIPNLSNIVHYQSIEATIQSEEKWYTSPEELNGKLSTFSSDIYRLGVLLFELFCYFESSEAHAAALFDLRHRILAPIFLSEYPKEAGFCLWLLHPEPSSRPTTREILRSELISEPQEVPEDQLSYIDEVDAESEILLHFLMSLKEHKHNQASKLVDDIRSLEADIKEVEKRHSFRTTEIVAWKPDFPNRRDVGFLPKLSPAEEPTRLAPILKTSQSRLMKNINQLENAYFSMRSQIQLADAAGTVRSDKDVLKNRERCYMLQNETEEHDQEQKRNDRLGVFFDGLCKYARYSKFEVRGTLRNGDLLSPTNVICSLSFDRDEEYFAAAGVSKKIKIFEFQGLLNDSVDIHYPVVEMSNKSKLSCVCWNNYIKNYLASTDYDGVVQLWDANTGQGFSQYTDHDKRAWSVDFSSVDPTKLASGGDDFSVKLWTINERKCISTIENATNVCCVQFSADSTHLLAFGSADYKTYCYDLRNTRIPWCTLSGHGRAVSYVKFIGPDTLISASTDNTLKLWDLNKTSTDGMLTDACSLTFRGHTNEKNFVGLSVSNGFITCGSETNEVYAYYKSLPMPITSHKFGSVDPISGQENVDDNGQFVSSVCWKGKSDMVVVANSTGSIKLLQMV